MDASTFDYDTECTACPDGPATGYQQCPVCNGDGTMNRLTDGTRLGRARDIANDPSEERFVLTLAGQTDGGFLRLEFLPVRSESRGGLEGRYGTWMPDDLTTGPMADYQPDTTDQLANRGLGTNGPYEVYGNQVAAADMAGGQWPGGSDLSFAQVVAWSRARGDAPTAERFEMLAAERP